MKKSKSIQFQKIVVEHVSLARKKELELSEKNEKNK
jgi:hypothetical protein